MVKVMDCRIIVSKFCTPVMLLRSLSDKYPWETYEPRYPPSYGLSGTTTVLLEGWIWHYCVSIVFILRSTATNK